MPIVLIVLGLGPFSAVMLFFVIPLTVMTFVIVTARELRRGGREAPAS